MPARQRNPRGQGERLRNDIIGAASRLLADPASPPLTLRAVAREVGVAATSVYLHFDDVDSLILAVAERGFGELVKLQDEARDAGATACERVRAGCIAYCQFGITYQGHYQVMFARPLLSPESVPPGQFPGYAVFQQLIDAVSECVGRESGDPESFRTAMLIWQQLHGMVSLRISRPAFPWPSLDETVPDVVNRILASATASPSASLPHAVNVPSHPL
ncbi:MAG: TetR/AcrR family transcriptional regulator [Streptosporangiaceae bacterium]|nr:TetR/AcrR family transcriptional regulator [Streptosporangiaceae bacterium]